MHILNPWVSSGGIGLSLLAACESFLANGAAYAAEQVTQPKLVVSQVPGAVLVRTSAGKHVLTYQLERPAESKLSVESGCYFHPVTTPNGVVITDEAPSDHPHHRGIFLAWVEMHGRKDADFWGWGEHAPKKGRRILNQRVSELEGGTGVAGFRAENAWIAEGDKLMEEDLRIKISTASSAYVLDLTYQLTPQADLKLSRWAFSGFCVRARKDGKLEAFGLASRAVVRLYIPPRARQGCRGRCSQSSRQSAFALVQSSGRAHAQSVHCRSHRTHLESARILAAPLSRRRARRSDAARSTESVLHAMDAVDPPLPNGG